MLLCVSTGLREREGGEGGREETLEKSESTFQ